MVNSYQKNKEGKVINSYWGVNECNECIPPSLDDAQKSNDFFGISKSKDFEDNLCKGYWQKDLNHHHQSIPLSSVNESTITNTWKNFQPVLVYTL